jgi:hypothetical protein
MNKQEQIAALKETIATASRQIEKLEKPEVTRDIEFPKKGSVHFCVSQHNTGKFYAYNASSTGYEYSPLFTNPKAANRWAAMLNVMLELRTCKGAVKPEYGKEQWYINFDKKFDRLWVAYGKCGFISCLYETEADALAAIETVGRQRILDAARSSLEVI